MASNHTITGKVSINKIEGCIILDDIYRTNENFSITFEHPINDEHMEYLELIVESIIKQTKLRVKGVKRNGNEKNPIVINDIRKVRL